MPSPSTTRWARARAESNGESDLQVAEHREQQLQTATAFSGGGRTTPASCVSSPDEITEFRHTMQLNDESQQEQREQEQRGQEQASSWNAGGKASISSSSAASGGGGSGTQGGQEKRGLQRAAKSFLRMRASGAQKIAAAAATRRNSSGSNNSHSRFSPTLDRRRTNTKHAMKTAKSIDDMSQYDSSCIHGQNDVASLLADWDASCVPRTRQERATSTEANQEAHQRYNTPRRQLSVDGQRDELVALQAALDALVSGAIARQARIVRLEAETLQVRSEVMELSSRLAIEASVTLG